MFFSNRLFVVDAHRFGYTRHPRKLVNNRGGNVWKSVAFNFISLDCWSVSPDEKPFCCLIGEWCCYLERGTISQGGGKKQGRGMWLPGAQSLWWVACQMPHCPNYPVSSVSPPGTNLQAHAGSRSWLRREPLEAGAMARVSFWLLSVCWLHDVLLSSALPQASASPSTMRSMKLYTHRMTQTSGLAAPHSCLYYLYLIV